MRTFALAALVGSAAALAPSSFMDCQKIVSVANGVAKTEENPAGIKLPEGFVIGAARNLCVAPRGQFCNVVEKRTCVVNGVTRHSKEKCEYMKNGSRVSAPTTVKFKDGSKVNLTANQASLTDHAVCWHAPQDHVVAGNTCQVRFNYKLKNGSMYRWAVSLGEHNVPSIDGALDSIVVAGKGCMALRYSSPNAQGRAMPLSEGYYARFPVLVRSVTVLAPRSKVCLAGEELVASAKGDKCVPCAKGFLSAKGDNKCHKAEICSHVTCKAIIPGGSYKKCKGNTYKSLTHDEYGGFTWMSTNNDEWKCDKATAPGFFLHTFHHGKEAKGTHHKCQQEDGKCVCRCYSSEMSFTPPKADCTAIFNDALANAASGNKASEMICFVTVRAALQKARCEVEPNAIKTACSPKPACMCTKMYKPVTCGNGKTYGNSCEAKCEGQVGCADKVIKPIDDSCMCTKMYKPVTCGNGKTYGNSCEAQCEGQVGCADKVIEPIVDPINSLFISEYVEGDSYRKAVELYNPTDSTIDLTDVQLVWHQNGSDKSGTAVYTIKSELKNKKINKGETFVICRKETAKNRVDVPNNKCDLQIDKDSKASMAVLHNGDDAITLEHGGKVIDIIGKVGQKKVWKDSKGKSMTQNKTIRRKKAISAGNPVWDAAEWNAYSKNQLNGLGNHNFQG